MVVCGFSRFRSGIGSVIWRIGFDIFLAILGHHEATDPN